MGIASVAAQAAAFDASVVFLGESHDNPHHHDRQAQITQQIQPSAIVWEMLTGEQAESVTPDLIPDQTALEAVLDWGNSGWPDFAMYHPIFAAAPNAATYGAAIPRDTARAAMADVVGAFSGDAEAFGLVQDLPPLQQSQREDMQQAAHCNALPEVMLPMMVSVQLLRDAELARVALQALQETGGPVVVITGNGHARTDWGAPAALRTAAPEVTVFSLGQGEDGRPPLGTFDLIEDTPGVERGDPCAAFATPKSD